MSDDKVSVEQFATQLKQRVLRQAASRGDYVFAPDFAKAVDAALSGEEATTDEFPRMLFWQKSRTRTRIVNNKVELEAALAEGWGTELAPLVEEGFPEEWVESVEKLGWNAWWRRRVKLWTSEEKSLFLRLTEGGDGWVRDDERKWSGTWTTLEHMTEQRKQELKQIIDQEPLFGCE